MEVSNLDSVYSKHIGVTAMRLVLGKYWSSVFALATFWTLPVARSINLQGKEQEQYFPNTDQLS